MSSMSSSGVQDDSQDRLDRMKKAVDSLSQSIHRLASAQLQLHSRVDCMEAAHCKNASAVDTMTTTIRADLQTMQRQSCLEVCDFLGRQFQKIQQGGYMYSCQPAQEATGVGFQSPANVSQDRLESLQKFIQQEFQSLRASMLSEAHVSGEDAVEMELFEEPQSVEAPVDCKNADSDPTASSNMVGDVWEDFQVCVSGYEDHHNAYHRITKRVKEERRSLWHRLFKHYGVIHLLHTQMPKSRLATFTESSMFQTFQTILILSNTAVMGYESDFAIKAALQDPKGEEPAWLSTCNLTFNVIFTIELLLRIVALRTWFFVSPRDWRWNVFDVAVVASSLATDLMGGVNFSFIRTFRILRAVRAVRVIRVLRFFRELRKILLSILACLSSLVWCFCFLAMTMFMFSILTLQGIVDALAGMDPNSEEHEIASTLAKAFYGSLADAMFTLIAAFTAGDDFFTFHDPIKPAGFLYSAAYVIYMLFVIIGVMNVLTGVFLAASESFQDRSLLVQGEMMEQESFVLSMLEVFDECDMDRDGTITWDEFSEALRDETLQAFLSSHRIEVTHARLIFDVLDEKEEGQVRAMEFVMGMLRLKGEAKAIDARIIQRELGMLPKLLNPNCLNSKYKNRRSHREIQSYRSWKLE